jgi:hypothetical protein
MTLLPENLKQTLKQGLLIEDLCSRYYSQYLVKTDALRFTFDGETVEELSEYCNKYNNAFVHYFEAICAYVALNCYDTFYEWMTNEQPTVIDLLTRKVQTFTNFLILWHQQKLCVTFPDKIYHLVQKIFDEFSAGNFDCKNIWSCCLTSSILSQDSSRIRYLIDVYDSINIAGDRNDYKIKHINFNLKKYGKLFIEAYPQLDITALRFKYIDNLYVYKHMVKCGYEVKNEDIMYLLDLYHLADYHVIQEYTRDEINEFFLELFSLAETTDEFINACFIRTIDWANLKIAEFLLENYNPTRTITVSKPIWDCYDDVHFLPAMIYNYAHRNSNLVQFLKFIDFSELTDEVIVQIFEAIISTRCEKFGLELVNSISPITKYPDHFKKFVLKAASKQEICHNISSDTILLMIKFGCVIDEEYLYSILEFVDADALSMILQMLNLTLEMIPFDMISALVKKYVEIFNKMIDNMNKRISKNRETCCIRTSLKEKISSAKEAHNKHPIYALDKLNSMNDYGGQCLLASKMDASLFEKLYKYTGPHQTDIIKTADKIIRAFIETMEKCYDCADFNKNNGLIPAPIIWEINMD